MLKQIIFSALFLCSVSLFAQTTVDEYKYMTKGYKMEQDGGLDPKKGYDLDKIPTIEMGNYTFEFLILKRSASKEVAGIICNAYSKAWGNRYYLGIPINNPDLFKLHYADIDKWDEPMVEAYAKATSVLFASMTSGLYAVVKDTKK